MGCEPGLHDGVPVEGLVEAHGLGVFTLFLFEHRGGAVAQPQYISIEYSVVQRLAGDPCELWSQKFNDDTSLPDNNLINVAKV